MTRFERQHDSDSEELTFVTIHAFLRDKKVEQAIPLLRINSQQLRLRKVFRSDINHAWYLLGSCLLEKAEYKDAGRCFRRALRYREDDEQAKFALSFCEAESGNLQKAIFHLLALIDRYGKKSRYMYNLGNAYFDLEMYMEASKCYGQVRGKLKELAQKNLHRLRNANAVEREE